MTGAWVYDSPAVYPDPWVTLALAAGRTERIGPGVGVVTPSLRNPVVVASSLATLEDIAPGRTVAGFGAVGSARWLLGKKPMLANVEAYIGAARALLNGEQVE